MPTPTRKRKTLVIAGALLAVLGTLAAISSGGSSGLSAGVVPIAVWDQSPQGGNVPAPYTDQAQAFKAMGVNIFLGLYGWPEHYGSDDGELAAAAGAGMYVIGGGDPSSDTDDASVASVEALLASDPSAADYFIGWQWLDEPPCTVNIASQIAAVRADGATGLISANEGSWPAFLPANLEGNAGCLAQSEANLQAGSVASADDYALTDPWHSSQCIGAGCTYEYGNEARNLVSLAAPGEPVWEFIETGTDDLGYSSQNGACDDATNLCKNGNEERATPAQVNSAAWEALIGGATGLEWFCDAQADAVTGKTEYDDCADNAVIAANLTYIDNAVQSYAAELTSPSIPGVAVAVGNPAVPVVEMTKQVGGCTYIFAESNRDGTTSATFTDTALAGETAKMVYNSAQQYLPVVHDVVDHTVSASGSFTVDFGPDYEVKIFSVCS